MLGVVVGRGKETKKRIEHESGACVQLLPPAADSESGNWTCRVTGGHDEMLMAEKIIQDLLDNSEVSADLACTLLHCVSKTGQLRRAVFRQARTDFDNSV